MRERGLAPPRLTTHAPQACLATKLQHSRVFSRVGLLISSLVLKHSS